MTSTTDQSSTGEGNPRVTEPDQPPAAEPIWAQKPTTWKVADTWAEELVERLYADVEMLGADDPDGVSLVYWVCARPGPEPMAVCIHADLDGFLVNAYDRGKGFGPDLLPLSSCGLGIHVPNRMHPKTGDAWFADIYPRVRDAVALAAEAVAAVRDGRTCPSAAGIGKSEYPCQRPAGHAESHPEQWPDHAHGQITWTADGITSSHPAAVVLR